ncbi:MAG: hypothetical protein ABIE42_03045 [Candidatus Eisenbacteria bacterium]
MLLLLLMIAILAAISMKESAVFPYWQGRLPHIATCIKEGRIRDAVSAAVKATTHGEERLFNQQSEPRGEVPTRQVPGLKDYAPSSEDRAPAPKDTIPRGESILTIE